MKRVLLVLPLLALLGACDPDPQDLADQRAVIESKLPPGCVFKDLGYYQHRSVVGVFCKNTTTTRTNYQCGKQICHNYLVTQVSE